MIQQTRLARNIAAAMEAVKEMKLAHERLEEVEAEPLIADDHKIAAIVAELSEQVARQERAFTHLADHVLAAQEADLRLLRERVEQLEKGATAKKK
jgi:predicted methyltransferase